MREKNKVLSLFNSIAYRYDLLNDLISIGMHKNVKRRAVNNVPLPKGAGVFDL